MVAQKEANILCQSQSYPSLQKQMHSVQRVCKPLYQQLRSYETDIRSTQQ